MFHFKYYYFYYHHHHNHHHYYMKNFIFLLVQELHSENKTVLKRKTSLLLKSIWPNQLMKFTNQLRQESTSDYQDSCDLYLFFFLLLDKDRAVFNMQLRHSRSLTWSHFLYRIPSFMRGSGLVNEKSCRCQIGVYLDYCFIPQISSLWHLILSSISFVSLASQFCNLG